MDQLEAKSLIEAGTRANFAGNALVLIVPSDSKLDLRAFSELTKAKKIAVGDPKTVPAGSYARDLLESTNLWTKLAPQMVFGENVRQVLDYVSRGEVDAGIVYATDAQVAGSKVAVAAKAPEAAVRPILYPIARVKRSSHSEAAKLCSRRRGPRF